MTELVPLRSLVASYIGGGWGNDEMNYTYPEPAFVIRGTDLADVEYGTVGSVPYRFHKTSNLVSRRLDANEIVMEVSGGSLDQPVGRVMFVDEHVLGALDGPVMCASFCKRVVPDAEAVHPSYLCWYLQAVYTSGLIERYQVQSTGIRNLQFEYLLDDLPVRLPSRQDQEQAAAVLDTILELLRSNWRRIEILEEVARLIYREWFMHFRFPGHADVEFVTSDLGPIPEGWEATTLGRVSENFDRMRKPLSKLQRSEMQGEYPYYGAAKIVDYVNDWIFDGEYLLFAEDGTVATPDGYPVLQLVNERFWVNNHTHILRGEALPTRFLWLAVAGYPVSGHVTGAAQPKITQANLNRIPVIRPEEAVIGAFMSMIDPVVDLLQNLVRQNEILRQARDLLLPRLISGELDVSGLDLDLAPVA